MLAALLSAAAAIIVAALTVFLTKRKEREAEWRAKKLGYYEEFFAAASGIVGHLAPNSGKVRFANAVNNLHLIASQEVMDALHAFCDEIAESNLDKTRDRHDNLWSALVWQIRSDLGAPPAKPLPYFQARLWASGTGTNAPH